jgi:cyclic-di-GMP phosphodiesterase TipF (flagellum assembly factor)
MLRFSAIFIAACMVLISASFAAVLYLVLAVPIVGALLCGIAALCGLALCAIVASALRGVNPSSARIVDLSRGVADLARQVAELGRRVAVMEGKVESAVEQADTAPLMSELDEIGVLIRQLAEQVSAHDVALQARSVAPARAIGPATVPSFASPLAAEGRAAAAMAPSVPPLPPPTPPPQPLRPLDVPDRAQAPLPATQASLPDRTSAPVPAPAPAPAPPATVRGDAVRASDAGAAALVSMLKGPPGYGELDGEAQKRVLREAVAADRLEFYLQPILALPQRKPRYYEALARLRTSDGELLTAADFLPMAAACGLLPRVDNLLLLRCVQVVRRLMIKNRDVGLIGNIAAATLSDAECFPQFVEFLDANRALAPALTFEFTQAAYRAFGAKENKGLATLMGLGFRFSMDNVADLKFEPRDLADRGFRFIKVPPALLLRHGGGAGAGDIHPADLAGLLSRFGIEMIVEKIETEATVLELLDLDVRYGQGHLFSPPRPVRAEVLAATQQGDEAASAKAETPPQPPQALPQVPQAPKTDGGAAVPVGAGAGAGAGANVSSLPDRRLEALQRPTALAQIARTVATRVAQGGVMGQESGARS